jgi:hypothetical protein
VSGNGDQDAGEAAAVALGLFEAQNRERLIGALPPGYTPLVIVSVRVAVVDGAPCFVLNDLNVTSPQGFDKSTVTRVELTVEVWAEALRRALTQRRIVVP